MNIETVAEFVQVPADLFVSMANALSEVTVVLSGLQTAIKNNKVEEYNREVVSKLGELESNVVYLSEEAKRGIRRNGFYSVGFVPSTLPCITPLKGHRDLNVTRIYGLDGFHHEGSADDDDTKEDGQEQPPPTASSNG
jgi:hypothetical protein